MKEHELRSPYGARRERKRVGRGHGSGSGKTAGRGTKGQKARTGGNVPARFEGGQTPMVERLPFKRGFTNIFRVEYNEINLSQLASLPEGTYVTPEFLKQAGLIKSTSRPTKILASGELDHPLTVKADKFSSAARQKIEAAGGTVEEIGNAASSS